MRISVEKTDPGFRADAYRYEVLLDGVPLQMCLTADEERSTAKVVATDSAGKIVVDEFMVKTKWVFGHVRVRLAA